MTINERLDEAAHEIANREAMARYRAHQRMQRDERNLMALAYGGSIIAVLLMMLAVWFFAGGAK